MSDVFPSPPPVIETERLRLRALTKEDAHAIFRYTTDPEVARYTLWSTPRKKEDTQALLRFLTAKSVLNWALVLPKKNEVIGMVFLHSLETHHQKAEIAFNLAKLQWGKGLMTEAATAVLHYGFNSLSLHRIEATCMPDNIASERVLCKIGMTHEGQTRESHSSESGFHDMNIYGILSSEFYVKQR